MCEYKDIIYRLFERNGFPDDAFYLDKRFDGRKLIIYGAGECCHYFIEIVMRKHGYLPVAVLDRALKRGDSYIGIPGYSPLDYGPTDEEKRDATVIICVGKEEYYKEIITSLKGLGFQDIIFMNDIYEIHNPFNLPASLEDKGFDFYRENKDQILTALELFNDDMSRNVYTRYLQSHMERKPVFLPKRPREEQYFPADIRLSTGHSRFICCGCDTGDAVRALNQRHGKVEAIACFEPDPTLFHGLAEYLWKNKEKLARDIVAMPCAAYSREDILPFSSANREGSTRPFYPTGFGSRILDSGETYVQTVSLDHTLPGFRPTFICIDAEAAELEILRGAEGLIRAHRPDLGVCVYHSPCHLWEIPLHVHNLVPEYKLYLRNYTTLTGETVMYATM